MNGPLLMGTTPRDPRGCLVLVLLFAAIAVVASLPFCEVPCG